MGDPKIKLALVFIVNYFLYSKYRTPKIEIFENENFYGYSAVSFLKSRDENVFRSHFGYIL